MVDGTDNSHLIHFETRAEKPSVFRITEKLIATAKTRNAIDAPTTLGVDLSDLSWLPRAKGLVTSNDIIRDPLFPIEALSTAAPNLKWIHIIGAGIEPLLPLDWLPPDVTLTNNSGVHFDKAAESVAMILLMLNGRIPEIATNQRNKIWDQIFTSNIRGKTVLIVGVGDMGQAAAKAGRLLGMHVIGVRRSASPHPLVDEMVANKDLDSVLTRADFIVLTVPLTSETKNMFNRQRFERVKRGAGFFNFGRAGSIDHDALVDCLNDGRLSGAVIDVVDSEPLDPSSPLWHAKNLFITPHVTSDDLVEYIPKTLDLVFENFKRLKAAQPLLNCVDRVREY